MTRWSTVLRTLAVPALAATVLAAAPAASAGSGGGSGPGQGSGQGSRAPSGPGPGRAMGPEPSGAARSPHRSGTFCALSPGRRLCDGTDPVDSACASGAYTVRSSRLWYRDGRGPAGATAELRYSPRCGTNWSRVTFDGGRTGPVTVMVCRGDGYGDCTEAYRTRGGSAYSDQLYARDVPATAYAWCCGAGPGSAGAWARG
ncbi:DUF2690 domain-containing protein [Microbispora triticiradicis]|uniref:DUF2690 domain-containing protein n=1 Tax=Microbispora tritici TaxID=2604471 RepID=A0ABY3M1H7_9ACTN|nr:MULTISPECIES: DUF2690 domain-containing protein [Microbispora]TYB63508.1 DUF2690 domain-containing protein [Microbispora tritici]